MTQKGLTDRQTDEEQSSFNSPPEEVELNALENAHGRTRNVGKRELTMSETAPSHDVAKAGEIKIQ